MSLARAFVLNGSESLLLSPGNPSCCKVTRLLGPGCATKREMLPSDGRTRVVVEGVRPEIDCGAFAAKRIIGDLLTVEADIYTDSHDLVAGELLVRYGRDEIWRRLPMKLVGQDRWQGGFQASKLGKYYYTVEGWIDRFGTWRHAMIKRIESANDARTEYLIGAILIEEAASRAGPEDAARLQNWARILRDERDPESARQAVLGDELAALMERYPDRRFGVRYGKELSVIVDRERAGFSAWYEMFPRSCAPDSGSHGTLRDCEARLPYVAAMGFDVLYLPPIHPIGHTRRKGKNNATAAAADDVGSPWAIGSEEGGHTAIDPKLGTLDDLGVLIAKAKEHDIEIALDLAFQCSPDHPYVRQHPEWFRKRPDGTIQYAENPPKKYEDIYPLDFETPQWTRAVGGIEARRSVLDRARRTNIPGRQSAHQSVLLLGMDDWRGQGSAPGRVISGGSVYSPEADVSSRQGWVFPVLHLLHVAQYQARADEVFSGIDGIWSARILSAEPLAEYARHPPGVLADRRARGFHDPLHSRRHAGGELRDLRSGIRALRRHRRRTPGSEEYLNSEKYELK